jgi:Cu/Ag efflux pump CusA
LIGIFLLLQACFGSWRLGLIAFVGLPTAVAGGILAVLVSGGVVSLGSIVGFLAVLGIAARNAVSMISHYQHLQTQGSTPFGLDLVIRGARERMASVVAGTLAIIAALLPILVLRQSAGLEIVQPTAIVIVGGLLASAVFTLFILPALYLRAGAVNQCDSDLGLVNATA